MDSYILPFLYLLEEMSPYLLLGFLIAGILHAFVPQSVYHKWLGGDDVKSVLLSILFGVPLPLCSCGVIPTAVSMRKEGASKGATTAFLIATPQTGVDSIAATWSVLGLPFAIMRPVVAMITGFVGGIAANFVARNEKDSPEAGEQADTATASATAASCAIPEAKHMTFWEKCKSAVTYGFSDMIQDIGRWLVIGLILAGLITIFVPDDFFVTYSSNRFLNMLLVLVISVPMYVCATGSIPVAAALMLKGLSPGAALVFLMAGPATNIASMLVLGKTLGRKSLIVYLATIIIGAVGFGLLVDSCLPQDWFTQSIQQTFHSACCHDGVMGAGADAMSGNTMDMTGEAMGMADGTTGMTDGSMGTTGEATGMTGGSMGTTGEAMGMTDGSMGMTGEATGMTDGSVGTKGEAMGMTDGSMGMTGEATGMTDGSVGTKGEVMGMTDGSMGTTGEAMGMTDGSMGMTDDSMSSETGQMDMSSETPWWQVASTILFVILLVKALIKRFTSHRQQKTQNMKTYIVKGMMCNHCKANVESHIAALEGTEHVNVDLASGIVTVDGPVAPETVISTVTSLGYDCELQA